MKKPDQVVKVISIIVIAFSSLYILSSLMLFLVASVIDLSQIFHSSPMAGVLSKFPSFKLLLAIIDNLTAISLFVLILAILSLYSGIKLLHYSETARRIVIIVVVAVFFFEIGYLYFIATNAISMYPEFTLPIALGIGFTFALESAPLGLIVFLLCHKDVLYLFVHRDELLNSHQ